MNELLASFIEDIGGWSSEALRWFEGIVPTLQILSIIFTTFLLWGIGYSVIKSGFHYLYADEWYDRLGFKDLPQRRARRIWKIIVGLIQKRDDRAVWNTALEETDKLLNEGLKLAGYGGDSIRERIAALDEPPKNVQQLKTVEDAKQAHIIYEQSRNEDYKLTHDMTIQALRQYKKVLQELGLLIN